MKDCRCYSARRCLLAGPCRRRRRSRAGIEAWQKGDHAAAVAIWTPLAEKGDADAAFNLGQAYRLGRGRRDRPGQRPALVRAGGAQGPCRRRRRRLGLLLFQNGNRPARDALAEAAPPRRGEPRAHAAVRHRPLQWRRRRRAIRSGPMPTSAAPPRRGSTRPRRRSPTWTR